MNVRFGRLLRAHDICRFSETRSKRMTAMVQ